MFDERSISWELLFPTSTIFEGRDLPSGLQSMLDSRNAAGPERVLVGRDLLEDDVSELMGYDGVVAISSSLSNMALEVAGFQYVERFVALPSLKNLRWLVPVASGAVAAGALSFYTPYKRRARLQRQGLQMILRLWPGMRSGSQILVARKTEPALVANLKAVSHARVAAIAISSGTVGPARKPTVSALDCSGYALAFAKVATTAAGTRLVQNEAVMLRHLEADPRLRGLAPALLHEGDLDGRIVTIQSPLEGELASEEMSGSHRRLLDFLAGGEYHMVSESSYVRGLLDRLAAVGADMAEAKAVAWQAIKALAGVELPRTFMHGDFAPWNLRLQGEYAVAFDWEYGHADALPCLDELHHIWQVGTLLRGWTTEQALTELDSRVASRFDLEPAQSRALVDIYLVGALLQALESGATEDDDNVLRYRAALTLRTRKRTALEAVPV